MAREREQISSINSRMCGSISNWWKKSGVTQWVEMGGTVIGWRRVICGGTGQESVRNATQEEIPENDPKGEEGNKKGKSHHKW